MQVGALSSVGGCLASASRLRGIALARRDTETTIQWMADADADGTALVGTPRDTAFGRHMAAIAKTHPDQAMDAHPVQPDGYRLVRIPCRWIRVVPGRGQKGETVTPPFMKVLKHATPEVGIAWAWEESPEPKIAEAYVACPVFARSLARLGLRPVRTEPDGAAIYRFPAAWVKVRPPSSNRVEGARRRALERRALDGPEPASQLSS